MYACFMGSIITCTIVYNVRMCIGEIVERNNDKGIKWLKLSAEQVTDADVWCSWLSLGWG